MSGRKQLNEIMSKFFTGMQDSVSLDLYLNSVELHFEGISDESRKLL